MSNEPRVVPGVRATCSEYYHHEAHEEHEEERGSLSHDRPLEPIFVSFVFFVVNPSVALIHRPDPPSAQVVKFACILRIRTHPRVASPRSPRLRGESSSHYYATVRSRAFSFFARAKKSRSD